MSFDGLVVVTDSDLARYEPEATNPDRPWGFSSWPTQIELAKRTLRIWIDADYPTIFGASDRIRDLYPFAEAKTFISSAYADVQTELSDPDEEDLDLAATLATPASDALYVANAYTTTGIYVRLLDSVNAASSTLTVSYWGAAQWTAVPSQSDGTAVAGATMAQSGRVTWTRIADWDRRSLDGSDEGLYWLRLQVDNALTAGTSVSQLLGVRLSEGLRSVATMITLSFILRGLALQSPDSEEWRTRADTYMDDAKALYDRLKLTGGIPLDADDSGAVDPAETGASAILALGKMPRA